MDVLKRINEITEGLGIVRNLRVTQINGNVVNGQYSGVICTFDSEGNKIPLEVFVFPDGKKDKCVYVKAETIACIEVID